ncbi:MAG: MFS transporter, partial [Pseudomonadales bacterium]
IAMLFGKGIGFALFLGIMLSIFQQVTGINAILYYGAEIFSNALGYGPEDALKQQLWLGVVNLIFTFVAIYKVDSWGRKPLFIGGSIGMFAGLTVLGLTIYTQHMGVVSLIAVLAMSIAVAAQWLFNALVANSFPLVNQSALNQDSFNGALPYFIFASLCIVAMIFVWILVPETKGKTLEEMEALWAAKDQD